MSGSEPPAGTDTAAQTAAAEADGARTPVAEAGRPPLEAHTLRRRAQWGAVILGVRTVLLQLTVLGGTVFLARSLSPADFGTFAIINFALSFFAMFGDVGLGAALIQKSAEPSRAELSTIWWLQAMLGLALVLLVYLTAPYVILLWPDLPPDASWLLRALSVGFLLSALRTVPSILLERELRFVPLSVAELVGALAYWIVAVVLASRGWGASSLITATIANGFAHTLVVQSARPWWPSLTFRWASVAAGLRFGLAVQTKGLVGLANNAVTPMLGGSLLGSAVLGLNNFAQGLAYFPLNLVNIVGRVSFPLYSRLQHDRPAFAEELSRSVLLCGLPTAFFAALCFGLGPAIVDVVYGAKWLPALPMIYVYTIAISVGFLSPIVGAALDAIGKPHIILRLAIGWTLLNWVAVAVGTRLYPTGLGFSIAYSLHVVVGNLAVVAALWRYVPEAQVLQPLVRPALAAVLTAGLARWLLEPHSHGVPALIGAILACAAVFAGLLVTLDASVLASVRKLRERL